MKYSKSLIEALTDQYGTPLYVFDERGFRENYRALDSAMKSRYENYRIAYSFKTNYTPYICKTAKSLGAYAEVVSGMEYAIAKKIGYDDRHIVFNGTEKGREGIEAFENGCIINVDSLDELKLFCETAKANPEKQYTIGVRINLNIGQGFISRFGMGEKDAAIAFREVEELDNLRVVGLHCHISRCRNLAAWKKRTETMLHLADRFFSDTPEYLELGSGMFGSRAPEFTAQFSDVPSYEEYAEVTAGLIADHYRGRKKPILFTEPGTTLINRFVECITRVEAIKEIDNCFFAVLNASEHTLGETCTLKKLPVEVVPCGSPHKEYERIQLTGYTCLEQDVLYKDFKGCLAKGDYVVFGNTGGYSNVLKPPFIRPNCAMVAETADGSFQVIKSAESYQDILRTYIF